MDHVDVGRYWEDNAEAWTKLARAGYDVCRDGFNTPAFFAMLPDVEGLSGLDVGCGEGHNTRLLAGRGARVTGVDISPTFVRYAEEAEEAQPLGIRYRVASAANLPFEKASFDFATAFMSLMDMPETVRVLAEVFRVLTRRSGSIQVCKTPGSPPFSCTSESASRPNRADMLKSRPAASRRRAESRLGKSPGGVLTCVLC